MHYRSIDICLCRNQSSVWSITETFHSLRWYSRDSAYPSIINDPFPLFHFFSFPFKFFSIDKQLTCPTNNLIHCTVDHRRSWCYTITKQKLSNSKPSLPVWPTTGTVYLLHIDLYPLLHSSTVRTTFLSDYEFTSITRLITEWNFSPSFQTRLETSRFVSISLVIIDFVLRSGNLPILFGRQ